MSPAGQLEDGLQSRGIDARTMIADHEIDVPPVGHLFLPGADDDSVSLPAVVDGVDEKVVQRLEQQSERAGEEGKVRGNA